MKNVFIGFLACLQVASSFAQEKEFPVYSNGLIYSGSTMKQLSFIVDSLNLKFKTCALQKTYYTSAQARAYYINLEKLRVKEAKADLERNMPFDAFVKKYQCDIAEEVLVIKSSHEEKQGSAGLTFTSVGIGKSYGHSINVSRNLEKYNQSLQGKWVFEYEPKTTYSDESVSGFYFITDLESKPLPEKYARMVQYTNCMIDTASQIFTEKASRTGVRYQTAPPKKVTAFMDYVRMETSRPKYDAKNPEAYWDKFRVWDSLRLRYIDSFLSKQERFQSLLKEAVAKSLDKGTTSDEFEEYVGRYYSKKTELALKRGRIVVGGCSMDNSPRLHAMNIAVLSAETIHWDIFLRAHLDIMNDRFERASDGSYAWGERQTYIRELEELDINVNDLLLGISLRIENPSQNHYYGSNGRLGRALAESMYREEIETKMLSMIKDQELDDYNRILIYYLYLNYNYYLTDEKKKTANSEALRAAAAVLPEYIRTQLEKEDLSN
jgi:hypothetical protein